MAQAILDLYPDAVSEYGLIGCFLVTVWSLGALALLAGVADILHRRLWY